MEEDIGQFGRTDTSSTPSSDAFGRRVRLRPKPAAVSQIYGLSGLLQPLKTTNGMIWPYQPTITYDAQVDYANIELVHVNQEILAYTKTPSVKLTVAGAYSVQNQQEGIYALACIHFLQTVTKMYFGSSGDNNGTPPPVLLFDAYGQYMFNALPVLVTSFSVELNNDIDYVPINLANIQTYTALQAQTNSVGYSRLQTTTQMTSNGDARNAAYVASRIFQQSLQSTEGYIWLPSVFSITVGLTVQNTAARLRSFNLDSFRTGQLMKGGGWI